MSHDQSPERRDPLVECGPTDALPQEEFPDTRLSTVVEPRADGSRRCIFYPEEHADAGESETAWLATDHDLVVSVAQWR